MIAIRLGMSTALDLLGDVVDVIALPVLDLDQGVVELPGRIVRIHQLLLGAPALRGALLEQANGVAIAVVKVADACFLIGRRKGDGSSAGRQTAAYRHARDDRREVGLVEVHHGGFVVGRRNASLLAQDRLGQIPGTEPPESPDAASDQNDERDDEAANSRAVRDCTCTQFACSSAFNSTPPRCRRRISTAPVTELRMNSRPLSPDKVRALTTSPLGSVTLVPAVR